MNVRSEYSTADQPLKLTGRNFALNGHSRITKIR